MIDINIYESQTCKTVSFGRKGENLARRILFDLSALIAEFGDGDFNWVVRRPHETDVYIALGKEQNGNTAILNLTATETAISGYGGLELRYYVDDVIVKTIVWRTSIAASLGGGDVPDPIEDYIDQMREIAQEASESADAAGESATQAAVSEVNAAGSATEAAGYAANAAASAGAAAGSATDSAASASAAHTSEVNAANSATAAAGSATNAASSASSAAAAAANAGTSETAAAGSASAASTSAAQAAASASAADASAQDIAASAAQIQTNADDITDLKNQLDDVEDAVFDITEASINKFDANLVTSETITSDKRLYGNGTLRDATGIDVTPFLPIESGKTYTAGLVPAFGNAGAPWYGTTVAIEFYSEASETAQISRIDRTNNNPITFTVPVDATYYRFNIARSSGVTLAVVSQRMMLVYGEELPNVFTPYEEATKDSKIDTLKTELENGYSIEYEITSQVLTVISKYGNENITIEFGKRGPNNLPDFRYITAGNRPKFSNSTDWFGPFLMSAKENADGDDVTGRTYTGGNHNYVNTGAMDSTPTARNLSLKYYVNNELISNDAKGYANTIEIEWINRVQAYNTKKADGTGREVLEERHRMSFNGKEWEVYTEIEALEDIYCDAYYGMQCAIGQYGTIYMIGATYRQPFNYQTPHDSGNNTPNVYVAHDANDRLEMEVDRTLDLGKGTMYGASGTQGFRTAGSKGYTYFISQKDLMADDVYGARGWYRFIPQF